MPPHELNLKIDSIIILLRNINIKLGLCNGTRMRVLRLMENVFEAECIKTGRRALISRMPLTSELGNLPFRLRRLQFPIRPGYTLTSNKSQGQTVDRIGIYLPQPYFAHGQLYVSFSRVKSCESV
jgi:ATP-dependent DNA helicase PIF1